MVGALLDGVALGRVTVLAASGLLLGGTGVVLAEQGIRSFT